MHTAELCFACCRSYYKAALIIWPPKERTKTICEQGVDAALKQLAKMTVPASMQPSGAGAPAATAAAAGDSQSGDDARELAKAIWDKFGLNGTGVEFVRSIRMLGMQELALQIRDRYQAGTTTDCFDSQTWFDDAVQGLICVMVADVVACL